MWTFTHIVFAFVFVFVLWRGDDLSGVIVVSGVRVFTSVCTAPVVTSFCTAPGWKAELGLTDMCEDSWRWISNNPDGFN